MAELQREIRYSIEKYTDGSIIVFLHSELGLMPLVPISGQVELKAFIKMLEGCLDKLEIPEVFKEAMDGGGISGDQ